MCLAVRLSDAVVKSQLQTFAHPPILTLSASFDACGMTLDENSWF
jgi:hypothetical protein